MIDVHTIGAGGGSIGWIDDGGLLRVGPRSAGAEPGPGVLRRGGNEPTCTDADLVLGYLDPDYFLGGRMQLSDERRARGGRARIAARSASTRSTAAAAMVEVINVNMAAGTQGLDSSAAYDPRELPLVVAGGAGPSTRAPIADELEIPTVLVPRSRPVLCARRHAARRPEAQT